MTGGYQAEIARITLAARDRPDAAFPQPAAQDILRGCRFARIARIHRFWSEPGALRSAIERLVVGLHAASQPWVFALVGTARAVEIWFGARSEHALAAALRGSLGELTLLSGSPDIAPRLSPCRRVSGAPSACGDPATPLPADVLCRGLAGRDFCFLLAAEPIANSAILGQLANINAALTQAQSQARQRGEMGHDLLLERYLELGGALHQRLQDGLASGMWRVQAWLGAADPEVLAASGGLLTSSLAGSESRPEPVRTTPCRKDTKEEPVRLWPLSSAQAALLALVPGEEYPGYEMVDRSRFGLQPVPAAAGMPMVELGQIVEGGRDTGNRLAMPLDDLAAHGLIAGVTGSGKTNTCFHLLAELAKHDVPFMVIESAKSEYRELLADLRFKRAAPRIFTIGDERIAPLRLNPFAVDDPAATLVQTHIDYLKELFAAAFVLYPPMPYVLERSLEEVYTDRGWDLADNTNARQPSGASARSFPTLNDLVDKVRAVVNRLGYGAEVRMNVLAGLVGRLDQLRGAGGKGQMLNTRESISSAELFGNSCILELKSLVSDDEKAFLIGLLLIRLYEYHDARRLSPAAPGAKKRPRPLRHVTLIEEAHRLLRNVSTQQSTEAANPKGRAVETFANILSEVRAYGEGIVMAEQIPVKLVPDAIKNTNLKIVHRLLAEEDRRVIGDSLNLLPDQKAYLARLPKGQAIVYTEQLMNPVEVRVPHVPAKDPEAPVAEARLRRPANDDAPPPRLLERLQRHDPHSYRRLDRAFRLLFRTLREEPPDHRRLFIAFFRYFSPACEAFAPVGGGAERIFAAMLENELEARGRLGRWSFDAMEKAAGLARRLVGRLTVPPDETPGGVEGAQRDLAECGRALAALHRLPETAALPHPGCRLCRSACAWRFDVAAGAELRADEMKALDGQLGKPEEWPQLAQDALRFGRSIWPDGRPEVIAGVAYCLALQRMHLSGRDTPFQERTAQVLHGLIAEQTGGAAQRPGGAGAGPGRSGDN